jgi:hypothetical protein
MVPIRQIGTTIAWVHTPKGIEPHGRRRRILAACLAPAYHLGGKQGGGIFREDGASANSLRRVDSNTLSPREPQRLFNASALSIQKGGFVATIEASAPFNAPKKRQFPSFGSGPGEARCDDVRVCTVTCDCVRCQTEASANVRHNANTSASSTPASLPTGLALSTTKTRLSHPRVTEPKPVTWHPANSGLVALPRKFAEMFAADYGIRRLATAVIL